MNLREIKNEAEKRFPNNKVVLVTEDSDYYGGEWYLEIIGECASLIIKDEIYDFLHVQPHWVRNENQGVVYYFEIKDSFYESYMNCSISEFFDKSEKFLKADNKLFTRFQRVEKNGEDRVFQLSDESFCVGDIDVDDCNGVWIDEQPKPEWLDEVLTTLL